MQGTKMRETKMRKRLALCAIGGACLFSPAAPGRAQTAPALAIAALDFIDTSGEVRDQKADHARRLKTFTEELQAGLAAGGTIRIVPLDCPPAGCPTSSGPPAELAAAAGRAGAAYVLAGGIHKMSTLVQWAKIEIREVGTQKIVFDRLLTFRGDDDAAWRRAEEFLARDILTATAFR
jgi:Protein of unknown function (DUF2380)